MSRLDTAKDHIAVKSAKSDFPKPKHVSMRIWEKFKKLEKRVDEITERSKAKRIKHLQKSALENVISALKHSEDIDIVQIPFGEVDKGGFGVSSSSITRKRPLPQGTCDGRAMRKEKDEGTKDLTCSLSEEEKNWNSVRDLMGVNDHLTVHLHDSLRPKPVLEVKMEEAIAAGDLKTAEELSDHLAKREFGEKIVKAIDAKNFLQQKQKQEEMARAKRRKKLHWGFEAKQRWETKSNM